MNNASFRRDTRGQTLFDFILGAILLLVILVFVMLFIPNILQPLFPSATSGSLVDSGRIASDLTHDVLRADGKPPNVLSKECTVAFFTGTPAHACDVQTNNRRDILGLDKDTEIRVTLRTPDGDVAVIDGARMIFQSAHPDNKEIYKSIRIVSVNGTLYELHVSVW